MSAEAGAINWIEAAHRRGRNITGTNRWKTTKGNIMGRNKSAERWWNFRGKLFHGHCKTLKTDQETVKLPSFISKASSPRMRHPSFTIRRLSPCGQSQSSLKFHGGGNFDIILTLWRLQASFQVPMGWKLWYRLHLVATPSQFWSSMGVGILISA